VRNSKYQKRDIYIYICVCGINRNEYKVKLINWERQFEEIFSLSPKDKEFNVEINDNIVASSIEFDPISEIECKFGKSCVI
jgi:hypothetical protein